MTQFGFLWPIGLIGLLGIPLIIILYMLRPKNKPTVISSTYLWESVLSELESAAKIEKLRSSLLMFLHILTVLLLVLLLAGLFRLAEVKESHTIVVIDNTITMQSEDVSPSRIEQAKVQGAAYVNNLPDGQKITLIEMQDVPIIHVNQTSDTQVLVRMIESIEPSHYNGDYAVLTEVINAITAESGGEIVYFGDKTLPGSTTYYIGGATKNVGISDVTYSNYDDENISVLATIYSTEPGLVQLSLYGDDVFLDAMSVEISESLVAKVFFKNVPDIFQIMKVTVDDNDSLAADNTAYLKVSQSAKKKVALITEGNIFLEKVLLLSPSLELYKVQMDNSLDISGFDLYIYDGIMPETLPESGTVLMFNVSDVSDVVDLGYASNPNYNYYDHPITNHLETNEYAIGLTHIYELPLWAEPIMDSEEGVIAFSGNTSGINLVVFGFDIHNTDMPLTASYPIMMTNLVDYYLNRNQIAGENYLSGETIDIDLSPKTVSASIVSPSGITYPLSVEKSLVRFYDTNELGVYKLITKSDNGEITEAFVVNASASSSQTEAFLGSQKSSQSVMSKESLALYIGIILLLLLVVEWLIYGMRRKSI